MNMRESSTLIPGQIIKDNLPPGMDLKAIAQQANKYPWLLEGTVNVESLRKSQTGKDILQGECAVSTLEPLGEVAAEGTSLILPEKLQAWAVKQFQDHGKLCGTFKLGVKPIKQGVGYFWNGDFTEAMPGENDEVPF
jgi:hypothetical protein